MKSVVGVVSTFSVAPQLPPRESLWRSIQALARPNRFAGAWSWRRLCAVCRTSARSRPKSDLRCDEKVLEVGVGGLVGADILGGVDGVERDAQLAVRGGEAFAVDVREDDEPVMPLQDAKRVRGIRERRPERHRCAERRIERVARLEAPGSPPCSGAPAPGGRGSEARARRARGGPPTFAKAESAVSRVTPGSPPPMMSGCSASQMPVSQSMRVP